MAFTDFPAAAKLRELREDRGLNSPETLAASIKLAAETGAPWADRGTVDAWTIRAIEKGHVPGPRIRFVIASYFGLDAKEIWEPRNWNAVETSIAVAGRAVPA